jgi:Bacterial transcriptional activator domain
MGRLPSHHVPRPRLTDQCRGADVVVVVVEAAAGYGKSVLAALAGEACAIVIDDAHHAARDAGALIDRIASRVEPPQRLIVLARRLPEGAQRLRRAELIQLGAGELALRPEETLELAHSGFGLEVSARRWRSCWPPGRTTRRRGCSRMPIRPPSPRSTRSNCWPCSTAWRGTCSTASRVRCCRYLLPHDLYEEWADGPREEARRTMLDLLDLCAAAAARRGDLDEARRTVERTIELAPYNDDRYLKVATILFEQGRRGAALSVLRRARSTLSELGVPLPPQLQDLEQALVSSPAGPV